MKSHNLVRGRDWSGIMCLFSTEADGLSVFLRGEVCLGRSGSTLAKKTGVSYQLWSLTCNDKPISPDKQEKIFTSNDHNKLIRNECELRSERKFRELRLT